MTNDRDIYRFDVNEHGELPLSNGRYVRYEDYEDAVMELREEFERLKKELDNSSDYSDGFYDGYDTAMRERDSDG